MTAMVLSRSTEVSLDNQIGVIASDNAVDGADYLHWLVHVEDFFHLAVDKNYFYFFAKLRDTRSLLDEGEYDRSFEYRGIFIDIFPFDKLQLPLQRLKLQSYAYTLYRNGKGSEGALRKIRALTWFNRNISFPVLRAISKLTGGKTLTYDFGIPFHIVYDEKDIFPLTTHAFEGIELSVPGNSDHMLRSQFGDYMTLPNLDHVEHHVVKLEFLD